MAPEWARGDRLRHGATRRSPISTPPSSRAVERFDRWLFVWAPGNSGRASPAFAGERDAAMARCARSPGMARHDEREAAGELRWVGAAYADGARRPDRAHGHGRRGRSSSTRALLLERARSGGRLARAGERHAAPDRPPRRRARAARHVSAGTDLRVNVDGAHMGVVCRRGQPARRRGVLLSAAGRRRGRDPLRRAVAAQRPRVPRRAPALRGRRRRRRLGGARRGRAARAPRHRRGRAPRRASSRSARTRWCSAPSATRSSTRRSAARATSRSAARSRRSAGTTSPPSTGTSSATCARGGRIEADGEPLLRRRGAGALMDPFDDLYARVIVEHALDGARGPERPDRGRARRPIRWRAPCTAACSRRAGTRACRCCRTAGSRRSAECASRRGAGRARRAQGRVVRARRLPRHAARPCERRAARACRARARRGLRGGRGCARCTCC